MITPDKALGIVLEKTPRLEALQAPLLEAEGAVLAETVTSDMDLPPFDKSAMDGYAVRAEDVAGPPVELTIVEELPAGAVPSQTVTQNTCAKIMTGAPVPQGADTVIRVEDTERGSDGRVRILRADPVRRNICERGEDVRKGAPVLEAGHVLRPQEVALLASVGRERVPIFRRPRVAVLATGDELVPVSSVPGPGQIRDANSWSLLACCRRAGVPADCLGVARDDQRDLHAKIAEGLKRNVLLVCGGVSMGEWDLVPKVFEQMGVTIHFSQVRIKPGKPTVFATQGARILFGLPGNPVSALVAFGLFVRPSLRKMMGHADPAPAPVTATLTHPVTVRGDRTNFAPAVLRREETAWLAEPIATHGSADLVAFARANALVILEPGEHKAAARVEAVPLEI